LPAAIAGRFAGSLAQMMLFSSFLCGLFCLTGLTFSYSPDLPAGPTIIVIAGACYFLVALIAQVRRRIMHTQ
ncbi:MAG: metal ABC transporter permease, partial [Candidatus Hydrogenedentes bacterium]|nr:metal ABC transporter permease [Candidatus Hydrogenedentota bacterium]